MKKSNLPQNAMTHVLRQSILCIVVLCSAILFSSCSDDDEEKPDCDALIEQIGDLDDDYQTALVQGDCEGLVAVLINGLPS